MWIRGDGTTVLHSPGLQLPEPRYAIDPALNDRIIGAIRRAMGTMEDWTGKSWEEVSWPASGVALRWYAPPNGPTTCEGQWAGCAVEDAVALRQRHSSGAEYPAEMLYERALHEMGHALFRAKHSVEQGLMCIEDHCYRELREVGLRWGRGLRLTPLDHQVYALYAWLTAGMSLERVREASPSR